MTKPLHTTVLAALLTAAALLPAGPVYAAPTADDVVKKSSSDYCPGTPDLVGYKASRYRAGILVQKEGATQQTYISGSVRFMDESSPGFIGEFDFERLNVVVKEGKVVRAHCG
ncbi:hypothetical protein ACWGFX_18105 [Streptomyces xanthophaeus]